MKKHSVMEQAMRALCVGALAAAMLTGCGKSTETGTATSAENFSGGGVQKVPEPQQVRKTEF